ncbi:MAG TPA: acyl-CoA thioesterase II, partial [Gammaproteobacteria bacterium]|nr:acyl-CoA thioesterase II [Gammaproteobacteria bacterium]
SLDHAMWFHQHTDADEWLLFDQCSLAVDDSRGLNQGEIFDRAGRLIASCTQESMLRPM